MTLSSDVIIPLHALVLVQASHCGDALATLEAIFPAHEITSPAALCRDLWGGDARPDLRRVVGAELRHRVALKLSLGERVVVLDADRDDRQALIAVAEAQGATVLCLLADRHASDPQDAPGVAVVRLSDDPWRLAHAVGEVPQAALQTRFRGITVVGDVHGNLAGLQAAVAWARSRNHFVYLLGDVVDYGPDLLATLRTAHRLMMSGDGALICGNHERKIGRWLAQQEDSRNGRATAGRGVRLSDGNKVTTGALTRLAPSERARWCGQFRAVLARSRLLARLGQVTLLHGAAHPELWQPLSRGIREIEHYALYGEAQQPIRDTFRLSHRWVDAVPKGQMVLVGHDIRAAVPMVVQGAAGGTVVFLDTGSGKGGVLSSADLRFERDGGLRLENFNRHE